MQTLFLDADTKIDLEDGGSTYGRFSMNSTSSKDFIIQSVQDDKDIIFKGNDGSSNNCIDIRHVRVNTFNSSINLPDNAKINLGAGEDLQIYHDGSNSYVVDAGTGSLFLRGTDQVNIQSAIGNNFIKSTINAGTKIYFADAEKFETTDSGVHVTGQLLADSATLTKLTVDSATITNIANSVLTAKAITGTTVTTSGDIVSSGTISAGNLNVDSADIIKISRDNLLWYWCHL